MAFFVRANAIVGDGRTMPIAISGDGDVSDADVGAQLAKVLPPGGDAVYLDEHALRNNGGLARDLTALADGVTVARAPTRSVNEQPVANYELWVNGGPAAGWMIPAPPGEYVIGRAIDATLRIADPLLGRRHCRVTVAADGTAFAEDLGSQNGTYLEGQQLEAPATLPEGAVLRCGDSLVTFRAAPTSAAQLVEEHAGTALVHRREPEGTAPIDERIDLPKEPEPLDPPGLLADLGTAGAYAVATGGMALAMGSTRMLMFAAMSPIVGLISALIRRKNTSKKEAKDWAKYRDKYSDKVQRLNHLRQQESAQERRVHPGPGEISRICSVPTRRLWERRFRDSTAFELRIGSRNRASMVTTDDERDAGLVWMTPLTVSLRQSGTFGIKGPLGNARSVARSTVLQAAALHGPDEFQIVALLSDEASQSWEFLRWLPHLRADLEEPALSIATGTRAIRDALVEIEKRLDERAELMSEQPSGSPPPSPEILVLADAADALNDTKFLTLFANGPAVGVYSIIVDQDRLPDGCQASLDVAEIGAAVYERVGEVPVDGVLADGLDEVRADLSARNLARLRPARRSGAEIPKSVRLLDLLKLPEPTSELVAARWNATATDPSRKGVSGTIGHDGTGNLDLILSQDIPNMLVAGAPGTGKSEFLLTLVAGLAADQGPDEVRFIIIGFKGIQDFTIIKKLPHTLDVVGNLDARSFDRAMRMLQNEIERREIVLERAGAANIDAYRSMRLSGHERAQQPLPRLIVIADEFAELKSQSPEQYDKLESLTKLGRALGMHLILATQSPAGVVSGQIEATVPVRISFKLIGLALSKEVIGDPAAGMLPMSAKGRGFMSTQGAGLVEAQMARVAGRRPDATIQEPVLAVYAESLADTSQPQIPKAGSSGDPPDEEKDLWGLMEACCDAADSIGYAADSVPWAGPLPNEVVLDGSVDDEGHPVVGIIDDPDAVLSDRPIHRDYSVELGAGHLCLFGTSGSGRSTALVSSAVALSIAAQPLHLYGIDNTNGGLNLLSELPNCGGVSPRDHQLTRRILTHLQSEVAKRHGAFESTGVANINEYRGMGDQSAIPDLVLVIDRLDSLVSEARSSEPTANAAQANLSQIQKLLGEGSAVGLTVLASCGPSLPSGALMEQFRHRLLLRMSSRDDYTTFGISSSKISDEMIEAFGPGRALLPDGTSEVQFGVVGGPERVQQRNRIGELSEQIDRPPDLARIQTLPKRIDWDEVKPQVSLDAVPLGVDEAFRAVPVDLTEGQTLLVSGPRRSGRSTTLNSLICLLTDAGISVAVVAPTKSGVAEQFAGSAVEVWPASDEPEDRYNSVEVLVFDDADTLVKIREFDAQQAWLQFFGTKSTGKIISTSADALVDATGRVADSLKQSNRLLLQPSDRFQVMEILGLNHSKADAVIGDYPVGRGIAVVEGELLQPVHVPRIENRR